MNATYDSLTKADLSDKLSYDLGINKRESKDLVDNFFAEIVDALELGEEVKLTGFGTFDIRNKRSRPGRNPRTGEEIPITARRVVTFKPGQKIRTRVDDDA